MAPPPNGDAARIAGDTSGGRLGNVNTGARTLDDFLADTRIRLSPIPALEPPVLIRAIWGSKSRNPDHVIFP